MSISSDFLFVSCAVISVPRGPFCPACVIDASSLLVGTQKHKWDYRSGWAGPVGRLWRGRTGKRLSSVPAQRRSRRRRRQRTSTAAPGHCQHHCLTTGDSTRCHRRQRTRRLWLRRTPTENWVLGNILRPEPGHWSVTQTINQPISQSVNALI